VGRRHILSSAELLVSGEARAGGSAAMFGGEPVIASHTIQQDALDQDAVETLIGEGTTVDGKFHSEHPIRIRGTVRGEVESKRRVVVEAKGDVHASVIAREVIVDGQVEGEVTSFERAHIGPTARVVGELSAQVIVVDEGAYFEGHVEMSGRAGGRDDGLGSGAPGPAEQVPDA
jgi:cytoskeletal protein CcmA (bactofilin family)